TNSLAMSHSITCTSALHAIANASAWLKSEMAERFIVGGSEAALTSFTLAQMQALRLYSKDFDSPYPCRPISAASEETNTLVLGEGAAMFVLELADANSTYLAEIEAIGLASENIQNCTAISETGEGYQLAMQTALAQMHTDKPIDVILLHAPGTALGDKAELE